MKESWEVLPVEQPVPASRRAAERRQLEELVQQGTRRNRTRPFVLAGVGLAVVSATGAGVAIAARGPAVDLSVVHCHSTLDLGRGDNFAGTTFRVAGMLDGDAISNDEAVRTCADLWAQGILRSDVPYAEPLLTPDPGRIPVLSGCVTADGIAAVFPSTSDICSALGLEVLDE